MKKVILSIVLLLFTGTLFAQTYPEVSIRDIQYISNDDLLKEPHDYPSPLNGDTVTVTGVITYQRFFGADPDSAVTMPYWGAPAIMIQDTADAAWGGILVRFDPQPADASLLDAFNVLDTGYVVKVTGVVGEYYTTTQLNIWEFDFANVIGQMRRPKPVLLTLDSLVNAETGEPNYAGEKWEHSLVEIRNVTATDAVGLGNGGSYGIYNSSDPDQMIIVGNKGGVWRTAPIPRPLTTVDNIYGFIETRANMDFGWHIINPVYLSDVVFGNIIPPDIYNITRDVANVTYGQKVEVSANIVDIDNGVDAASLFYNVNGGQYQELDMFPSVGDSIYSATIPAQNDSSIVSFYIRATDNDGTPSYNPTDSSSRPYFYWVLNRPLTIQDVQKSPFGSGYSAYNRYEVTVSGVVTADSSALLVPDASGNGDPSQPMVYIQNGEGKWSGINLFGTEIFGMHMGDSVTVTGTVSESFGVTRIQGLDDPSKVVHHGKAVHPPKSVVLSTSEIGNTRSGRLPAEAYEGVLITYENVTVTDENADGSAGPNISTVNRNFGEAYVADTSAVNTRIEFQDGNHDYHNNWAVGQDTVGFPVRTGDSFTSVTGILNYSYGNYKLLPRFNSDFVGHVTEIIDNGTEIPDKLNLSQNYPNPFNPSTTIEFSLPQKENVTVKIFNILGSEVAELTNREYSAGNHKLIFNAAGLASGIYFYRIAAGRQSEIRKMILMK